MFRLLSPAQKSSEENFHHPSAHPVSNFWEKNSKTVRKRRFNRKLHALNAQNLAKYRAKNFSHQRRNNTAFLFWLETFFEHLLPFYIHFEARWLHFTDSKIFREYSDFLSKHLYWLKKSAWKKFCLMRRIPEHICYSLLQIIFKAESPVLPNSPEPCDWQVNVKPWAPRNLAKRLRTPTLTNRPHAQIH